MGEQLKMFMTGPEIKAYAAPGNGEILNQDIGRNRTATEGKMWKRKLKEASTQSPYSKSPPLADSIGAEGVHQPVEILQGHKLAPNYTEIKPQIWNGHHRVAVTSALHPDQFLPVIHHDDNDPDSMARWNRNAAPIRSSGPMTKVRDSSSSSSHYDRYRSS